MKLSVTTLAAKAAGEIELDDAVFGLEPRADILQRMVRYQLAKRQAGTHKTKRRSEIQATTAKFGSQKGGGRARHGARTAPQFVGGGKAHGPVFRSHAHALPKKVRALALRHALSSKAGSQDLIIVDDLKLKAPKTAALKKAFAGLGVENALIIGGETLDENFALAARNIPNVDVLPTQGVNVYDVLRRKTLVLAKSAAEHLEARLK